MHVGEQRNSAANSPKIAKQVLVAQPFENVASKTNFYVFLRRTIQRLKTLIQTELSRSKQQKIRKSNINDNIYLLFVVLFSIKQSQKFLCEPQAKREDPEQQLRFYGDRTLSGAEEQRGSELLYSRRVRRPGAGPGAENQCCIKY